MKFNIEIDNIDEASVLLTALRALQNAESSKPVSEIEPTPAVCHVDSSNVVQPTPAPVMIDPNEKDADGLVWDARIHSSNHKKSSDGRWQRRRNVADALFNSVKNELLGINETVAPAPAETVIPPVEVPVMATPVPPVAPVEPAPVFEAPTNVAYAPAAQPVPAVETPALDANALYLQMFAKLQTGFKDKKIDANYIQNTLASLNTMFGKNWSGLAEIKESVEAMNVVMSNLSSMGL